MTYIQSGPTGVNNSQCTFLQSLQVLAEVTREGAMEHGTCIFENRTNACDVKKY